MFKNFEFSHIGSKAIQEDAKLIFKHNNIEYYFIFDGHGHKKNKISLVHFLLKNKFLKNKIKIFFENNVMNSDNIKCFFNSLDKELINKNISSGVCLSGLICTGDLIYIINIGDTMVYVFDRNKQFVFKTPVHNLSNKTEMDRIIFFQKENLVKKNRYKKLAMTRTLGDCDCKNLNNEPLIATPEVFTLKNNKFYYFILATDGINIGYDINKIIYLYDFFSNTRLYDYCKLINQNNIACNSFVDNVFIYIVNNKKYYILNNIIKTTLNFVN